MKGGTRLGLSQRIDKQRTRLVLHFKYAPEEKIVIEIEKSWVQNKGVVFEVSSQIFDAKQSRSRYGTMVIDPVVFFAHMGYKREMSPTTF